MIASEPLPHFVDDLLGYLHETHPTHATLDGVHTHDDLLEDLSHHGIESDARALAGYLRRLDEIDRDALTDDRAARASHARRRTSAAGCSSSKTSAPGRRTRSIYADMLASSLAGQALFTHAPAPERARRVLSKLRQTPRLIQAARDNIKEPPGIFVKVGIETMRGALKFIDDDLPRAFATSTTCTCSAISPMRRPKRRRRSAPTSSISKPTSRRRRARSFRLGRDKFEQKLRLEEGITLPVDRLLAIADARAADDAGSIPTAGRPHERRRSARRRGRSTKAEHPAPGELIDVGARAARRAGRPSSSAIDSITMPAGEPITVAPTPDFYRWSFASMWTPGPFESKPTRAYYYLTDVDPSWPADRQDEHLRDYNLPDAVVDLDSRGLSRALPALPAPAPRRIEGAQVDPVRAGVVRRRLGALLRADDDRGGLRPQRSRHQARPARRSAHPPRALHRRHQAAHRRHVGRAGRALLPRRSVHGGSQRAARSRARHLRSDLSRLQRRQADAAEAAPGLQAAAGQAFRCGRFTTRCSSQRHRAVLAASRS